MKHKKDKGKDIKSEDDTKTIADVNGEEEKELVKLLEDKTKEAEDNYQRFLRACAELENYKKRVEREKIEIIKYSNENLLKEFVSVLDNLERALCHSNETENVNSLKEGVKLTLDQLLKTLKQFGLEQVPALGERFDPSKHEAVSVEDSSEHEDGTIMQEFQKAYFLHEKLLRPATVSVSRSSCESKKEKKGK
ncbi:MAG: nucleotide exchange factor GrpE [Thermodesulfobacteriota bacterium]